MGKKRANERGGATPRTAATEEPNVDGRTKQASPLVGATPGPSPPYVAGDPSIADEGWVRVRRSVMALTLIISVATMADPLVWKEALTIAAPDSAPLLAMTAIFAALVWRRWRRDGKRGLHPVYRMLGFLLMIFVGASFLPFNTTVTMYEVPLLSDGECRAVASAAEAAMASTDFVPTRVRFDPTTEVPLEDLPSEVASIVEGVMHEKLLPFLRLQYHLEGAVVLEEKDFYVEHYEAFHEPPPLPHIRKRQLTVRVELSPPEESGGGGLKLDSMGRSVQTAAGSALILPAKLRHGSDGFGAGTRSVLVGTLSVFPRTRWQRFVSMWRLWGLFSRRVRYIADKQGLGLSTWGASVEEDVVIETEGLDAGGNDRLEF